MSGETIVFRDVVKVYPGGVRGLDGASFTVRRGVVHALLGHNGAGKTTSMRLMLGLLTPTSGEVLVLGVEPFREPGVRRRLGYAGENPGLYRGLSVRDNLERFCELRLGDPVECRRLVREVSELLGLGEILGRRVETLSAGNRKRVALARALMGDPELLILDEPFNALDPVWRSKLRELLRRLAGRGVTIIYSSHVLPEVQELADEVTILRRGRVVYTGPLSRLLEEHGVFQLVLRVEDVEAALRVLGDAGVRVEARGEELVVPLAREEEAGRILELLYSRGVRVRSVETRRTSLEDIYVRLYGGG